MTLPSVQCRAVLKRTRTAEGNLWRKKVLRTYSRNTIEYIARGVKIYLRGYLKVHAIRDKEYIFEQLSLTVDEERKLMSLPAESRHRGTAVRIIQFSLTSANLPAKLNGENCKTLTSKMEGNQRSHT